MERGSWSPSPFLCIGVAFVAFCMHNECMMKPLKYATQAQAQEQLNAGSFVYHNPCCVCKKECSTPTLDIWKRRINEFGSIAIMYASYTCRKCRKPEPKNKVDAVAKAAPPIAKVVAKEPLMRTMPMAPMMRAKAERPLVQIKPSTNQRKPGDYMPAKPGEMAFSIWENGVYKGTAWHKTGEKVS